MPATLLAEAADHLLAVEAEIVGVAAHESRGIGHAGQVLEAPVLDGLQIGQADMELASDGQQVLADSFPACGAGVRRRPRGNGGRSPASSRSSGRCSILCCGSISTNSWSCRRPAGSSPDRANEASASKAAAPPSQGGPDRAKFYTVSTKSWSARAITIDADAAVFEPLKCHAMIAGIGRQLAADARHGGWRNMLRL